MSGALTGDPWDYPIPLCRVHLAQPLLRDSTLAPLIHVNRAELTAAIGKGVTLLRADTDYVLGNERTYPCLGDNDVGMLGAMPFLGVCAACVVIAALQHFGRFVPNKTHLTGGILISVVTLIAFAATRAKEQMWMSRLLAGAAQCPIITLAPVWVTHFGPDTRQTQWMATLQGSSAIGAVAGYATMGFFVANDVHYMWTFVLQSVLLFVLWVYVLLACAPEVLRIEPDTSTSVKKPLDIYSVPRALSGTLPADPDGAVSLLGGSARAALYARNSIAMQRTTDWTSPWGLGALFWHSSFISCWIFFGVTGMQLWATKYFLVAFLRSVGDVTAHFLCICVTGATLGLFLGSRTRFNFNHVQGMWHALQYMTCGSVIAVVAGMMCLVCPPPLDALRLGCTPHHIELAGTVCSLDAPNAPDSPSGAECAFARQCEQLANNDPGNGYAWAMAILWCVLCSGAAILPVCASMQLHVVDVALRPTAAAVNLFVTHLLGYAMGAWLPGYASEYVDGAAWQRARVAMTIVFLAPSIGLVNLLGACVLLRRKAG